MVEKFVTYFNTIIFNYMIMIDNKQEFLKQFYGNFTGTSLESVLQERHILSFFPLPPWGRW